MLARGYLEYSFLSIILVGLGGFLGSISRYLISGFIKFRASGLIFPYGTIAVNLIGSFLLGFILFYSYAKFPEISKSTKLFLGTGFMGGFTTFSTFSVETMSLLLSKDYTTCFYYILITVFGCVFFSFLGAVLAGKVS